MTLAMWGGVVAGVGLIALMVTLTAGPYLRNYSAMLDRFARQRQK